MNTVCPTGLSISRIPNVTKTVYGKSKEKFIKIEFLFSFLITPFLNNKSVR